MKNWKLFSLGLAIFGSATMISCSKSNNNTPASTNANVQYSAWIPIAMTYQGPDANGDSVFDEVVPASGVTAAVVDKGIVITYILLAITNGDSVITNADGILAPYLSIGSIDIGGLTNYSNYDFRYVIIPGGIATSSVESPLKGYTPAQIKALSYPAAMKLLSSLPASGISVNTLK